RAAAARAAPRAPGREPPACARRRRRSRGWTSPLILGALLGSVVVFAALVWFETRSSHPLVELSFFSKRRFSVAMGGLALTLFALSGTMFLLTQYLQFSLGYSPFQTGLRITPIALVLIVVASVSTTLARYAGSKVVVVAGMALIALGLQLLSAVTIHTTYTDALPAFFLLGIGSGLAIAPCTDAVMGSVPTKLAGTGSATNSTALQIGSALGVAVIGSLLAARYQSRVDVLIAGHGAPASVVAVIRSSLGGALAVAQRVGGASGAQLALAARSSFLAGLDFAVDVAAAIVGAAALIVAVLLPARAPAD
ncbi:MAG: MFS transporter, partial [Actinomycetales bacterium]|nr:MFS transporter [Actinomycetales bacterium]